MRNTDGSTAKVDIIGTAGTAGAAGVVEGLEMLGFDEDKDADAYWRASDALDKIISGAVAEEREACARLLENGRFLHDQAPTKLFATEAAAAIRRRNT